MLFQSRWILLLGPWRQGLNLDLERQIENFEWPLGTSLAASVRKPDQHV